MQGRSATLTRVDARADPARVGPEKALELIAELVEKARDAEDESAEPIVITAVLHPPTSSPSFDGP